VKKDVRIEGASETLQSIHLSEEEKY